MRARKILGAWVVCGAAYGFVPLLFGVGEAFYAVAASPGVQGVVAEHADDERVVKFFFSDGAWGGVPFSEAQKQKVIVEAMLSGKAARIENEVTHLLSAPAARVRRFTAVFEVDGSVQPPKMHSGYELELLVPYSRKPLSVELENAETGIVNRVEVEPDDAL